MISALRSVLGNIASFGRAIARKPPRSYRLLPILAVLGNVVFAVFLAGCGHANPKPQGMMLVRTADVWYGASDEGVGVCELYADLKTGQAIIWHDRFKQDSECWESIGKTLADEYKTQEKLIKAGIK